jgi:endonuclease G
VTSMDKAAAEWLLAQFRDGALPEELLQELEDLEVDTRMSDLLALDASRMIEPNLVSLYTVVTAVGRPSLLVQDNTFSIDYEAAAVWGEKLEGARSAIEAVLPRVGKIEIEGGERSVLIGTGVAFSNSRIVTNRHVAEAFLDLSSEKPVWKSDPNGNKFRVRIDMLAEHGRPGSRTFPLSEVIHVNPANAPDLALFEFDGAGGYTTLSEIGDASASEEDIAAIGFPSNESVTGYNLKRAIQRVFRNLFGVKRISPGATRGAGGQGLLHDCSTLGGSSGSAIVSLKTGKLVAIHASRGVTNSAVTGANVRRLLER